MLPFRVELLRFLEKATPKDAEDTGETPELTAPKVPDDVRAIALEEPLTGRRREQNA